MKKLNLTFAFAILITTLFAQYSWVNQNNFSGNARFISTGFAVNGKGYLVGGRINSSPITYTSETWEYNPATDVWTAKAGFPFSMASSHGFTINGKGYIAGGQNNSYTAVNSTYEYDPVANTWTPKANVPVAMNGGFCFVINNIAYIGCGAHIGSNNSTTVYAYNPVNNTWSTKANYAGPSVVGPIGFAIGNYGYAGCGTDGSGNLNNEFYKYDPSNNSWTQIASLPGKDRDNAMSFVLNGIAYVGGGVRQINGSGDYYALNDFYSYDPNTNTWNPAPSLPGVPRQGGVTFEINNSAYEVGGYDNDGDLYYNMVSQFADCSVISGITPMGGNNHREVSVFPNPTNGDLNVKVAGDDLSELTYDITNLEGQLVKSGNSRLNTFSFSTSALSNGVYLLTIKDNTGNFTVKRFEVVK